MYSSTEYDVWLEWDIILIGRSPETMTGYVDWSAILIKCAHTANQQALTSRQYHIYVIL